MPPDPATPGLLDLLTVTALREPEDADPVSPTSRAPAGSRSQPAGGTRRLWVEVEA